MWEVAKESSCIFSDYPPSLRAADTGPNKIHQGGEEWGLIVFCRYRGQYQRSASSGPHWDSICWVKSVPLLPTSWLARVGLHSGLKRAPEQRTGSPPSRTSIQTPEIMPSTNETCKHLNKELDYSGSVAVVEGIRSLVPKSGRVPVWPFLQEDLLLSRDLNRS